MVAVMLPFKPRDEVCVLAGPLRGVLFERLAHRTLQKGGTFRCRSLDTGGEAFDLVLDINANKFVFNKTDEAKQAADGVYAMPRAQNLAAIDAVVQAGCRCCR